MPPFLRLLILLVMILPAVASARPERIVSLGLCSDQLLLLLAGREQIAALSEFAVDEQMSYWRDAVGDLPLTDASAEDVIRHRPDLVVTNQFTAATTGRLLRQLGIRVETIPLARSVKELEDVLRRLGEWTGNREKAQRLIETMRAELSRIRREYAGRETKSIIIYTPNGFGIGAGTLEDDILRHAGYRNLAAELGMVGFRQIALETLLAAKPDVIQLDDNLSQTTSLATAYLRHPVFARLGAKRLAKTIPQRLRICAGPMITEAIEWMAAQR